MSIVERLTEGIVNRDLSTEGAALISKWEQTGLLEGISDDNQRNGMARLLENQAKELLRESSSMAAGDVEGFAAVAFPIVRRVFGGLLANDLVSVQPMSLPSGLIFFLDFTKTSGRVGDAAADSVYGGGRVGAEITGGADLSGVQTEKGLYSLNNAYSAPISGGVWAGAQHTVVASGAFNAAGVFNYFGSVGAADTLLIADARTLLRQDPDIASGAGVIIRSVKISEELSQLNNDNFVSVAYQTQEGFPLTASAANGGATQARRLSNVLSASSDTLYLVTVHTATMNTDATANAAMVNAKALSTSELTYLQYATADNFTNANSVGGVKGTANWLLESNMTAVDGVFGDDLLAIPEIDIKVDSVAVTANTRKLRAKWSPELGQDLNAYHNLDAEVELTGILSEQVALEIDREILEDLIKDAKAGTLHWSRNPGQFLNRETGAEIGAASAAPDFTGTVSEWYETLIETITDVSARIHRKTLRGGANFVVCSPEVATILEFTAGFRASVGVDSNGTAGAVNVGSISKKYDVHVDPYFPRNIVMVGRKGNSFLESGYVYAPYVPLQVTPTIFGTEDFAPRKGVMTRYGKKMVRPDMYGLVICHGLIGHSGGS